MENSITHKVRSRSSIDAPNSRNKETNFSWPGEAAECNAVPAWTTVRGLEVKALSSCPWEVMIALTSTPPESKALATSCKSKAEARLHSITTRTYQTSMRDVSYCIRKERFPIPLIIFLGGIMH